MKHGAIVVAFLAFAALPAAAQPPAAGAPDSLAAGAAVDALLDNTFRIDIETIAVTLDWYPASGGVDGTARLDFRLRPGQSRAVFNFAPFAASRSAISRLVIDGRSLSPQSDADVRLVLPPAAGPLSDMVDLPPEPGAGRSARDGLFPGALGSRAGQPRHVPDPP
jgi:hypothetical protein